MLSDPAFVLKLRRPHDLFWGLFYPDVGTSSGPAWDTFRAGKRTFPAPAAVPGHHGQRQRAVRGCFHPGRGGRRMQVLLRYGKS